jgi:hypothetical protein
MKESIRYIYPFLLAIFSSSSKQHLFPGLKHVPLNISKECMDHFYPYNAASESEQLGYERLTTEKTDCAVYGVHLDGYTGTWGTSS